VVVGLLRGMVDGCGDVLMGYKLLIISELVDIPRSQIWNFSAWLEVDFVLSFPNRSELIISLAYGCAYIVVPLCFCSRISSF
jgi:hypothetical protein